MLLLQSKEMSQNTITFYNNKKSIEFIKCGTYKTAIEVTKECYLILTMGIIAR